tara:strand:+ start:117 stop:305 length:189 start_codon:yes stop_codon:yes gene_type:complete
MDYIVYHTNKKGVTDFFVMNEEDKGFESINTMIIEPVVARSKTKVVTKDKTYTVTKDGVVVM